MLPAQSGGNSAVRTTRGRRRWRVALAIVAVAVCWGRPSSSARPAAPPNHRRRPRRQQSPVPSTRQLLPRPSTAPPPPRPGIPARWERRWRPTWRSWQRRPPCDDRGRDATGDATSLPPAATRTAFAVESRGHRARQPSPRRHRPTQHATLNAPASQPATLSTGAGELAAHRNDPPAPHPSQVAGPRVVTGRGPGVLCHGGRPAAVSAPAAPLTHRAGLLYDAASSPAAAEDRLALVIQ